jgi:hypothetical protein
VVPGETAPVVACTQTLSGLQRPGDQLHDALLHSCSFSLYTSVDNSQYQSASIAQRTSMHSSYSKL